MEQIDLTTPVTPPSTTNYKVERMTLDIFANTILVQLKGNNGEVLSKLYDATTTPTGATLLHSLNVGNFSTGPSLLKTTYNRLIADGVLSGTVSGTPS